MRALRVLLGVAILGAGPAWAAGLVGASRALVLPPEAPYDLENQTSLNEAERARWLSLFGRYADLYVALGLGAVRVGAEPPDLFSWGSVEPEPNKHRLLIADLFVEALVARGVEPVLPLAARAAWDHDASTRLPKDKGRYKDYVRMLVERYDGDTEFGVPPGEEYPDVTADGSVSIADWGATEAEKQAWATAHRVTWWEVGDRGTPDAEVGPLVQLTRGVMREASDDVRLVVGGMTPSSKGVFLARVGSLDPSVAGELLVDAVSVELDSPGAGLAALAVIEDARETFLWLGQAGLGVVPVWLTVGAGAQGGAGPCGDPRCSERTQAAQLVKLMVQALETVPVPVPGGFENRRFERVFLREPVEHGAGGIDGDWSGGGLLALAEGDPATAPLLVRPAWATVARLAPVLSDLGPEAVKRVLTFPDTATRRVYRIEAASGPMIVAWYNWDLDLLDAPYDGRFLRVSITGIGGDAVQVTGLYPTSIDQVTGGTSVGATLGEEVVGVTEGEVTIDVLEDAVLVEAVAAPAPEDAGPVGVEDAGGGADSGPVVDIAPVVESGGGGCGTSGGDRWGIGLALWALFRIGRWRWRSA